MSVESLLKKLWYGEVAGVGGFSGIDKLYSSAKKLDKNVTLAAVDKFLHEQPSYLHRKEFKNLHAKGQSQRWMDVAAPGIELDVDTMYLNKFRLRFKFALIGLDAFSRKVVLAFMTKLTSKNAGNHLANWFKNGHKYKIVFTDRGSEFGGLFDSKVKELGAKHRYSSTYSAYKVAKAERVIRTLRSIISRVLVNNKKMDKSRAIQLAVEYYNNTVNRSIGMTPNDAEKSPAKVLLYIMNKRQKQLNKLGTRPAKYKIGEKVYIKKNKADKGTFFKTGDFTILQEAFKIDSIVRTSPFLSYKLIRFNAPWGTVPGSFPENRLIRASDLKNGD